MGKGTEKVIEIRAATGIGAKRNPRADRQRKRDDMVRMLAGKGDTGTPEQQAHGEFVDTYTHVGDRHAVVRKRQDPIDRYYARRLIQYRQWQAGNRLRKILEACQSGPQLVARYDPDRVQGGRSSASLPQHVLDNQQALAEAMRAVGTILGPVLEVVVRDGLEASIYGRRRGRRHKPAEAVGMEYLKDALTLLAYHFGYLEEPLPAASI